MSDRCYDISSENGERLPLMDCPCECKPVQEKHGSFCWGCLHFVREKTEVESGE